MNNDQKSTIAGTVSAAGYGAGLATMMDPSLAMLLPPPFNFIVLGVGVLAQIAHAALTNKEDK